MEKPIRKTATFHSVFIQKRSNEKGVEVKPWSKQQVPFLLNTSDLLVKHCFAWPDCKTLLHKQKFTWGVSGIVHVRVQIFSGLLQSKTLFVEELVLLERMARNCTFSSYRSV